MNIGVQYYRAPFPLEKYWENDFKKIRESGLDTVQLWILWAWVESKPGEFNFSDYDRLTEIAAKNNLQLVLSTIAEIQPYWIHRAVPGSEMIDHMGHKVISSNRGETHFGLTPGGCTDHPDVWQRMSKFLEACVLRYRNLSHLHGWDCWNELRWNVQADGIVCFCPYTISAWHKWLEQKYGDLDGLNRAWIRRYGCWEEVMPGKLPDRPYTEMTAFEHFITDRATRHGFNRYELLKKLDPDHPVTLHGGAPTPLYKGSEDLYPLDRGNDWDFAEKLDGIGCSSFPKWSKIDDADFGIRVESVKSASMGKRVWLSEVQGGRAEIGFKITPAVDALTQQRWIWNGIACGADTILFWCWRDEVFGRESDGFGIIGNDGLAEERLAAMQKTGRIVKQHQDLLKAYQPDEAQTGVLFSPQVYYLTWAQEKNAETPASALAGYLRALVRKSIPFRVIEENHLERLGDIKILFLPRLIVTSEDTEEKLCTFVRNGGILVCESECGAFSPQGIYRYPEDRFLNRLCGVYEIGRRPVPEKIVISYRGDKYTVPACQWCTPYTGKNGDVHAGYEKFPLVQSIKCGPGKVILLGSYYGDTYRKTPSLCFENLLQAFVRETAGSSTGRIKHPQPDKNTFIYIKTGSSGNKKMLFIFFPEKIDKCIVDMNGFPSGEYTDILSGEKYQAGNTLKITGGNMRIRVLVSE